MHAGLLERWRQDEAQARACPMQQRTAAGRGGRRARSQAGATERRAGRSGATRPARPPLLAHQGRFIATAHRLPGIFEEASKTFE